MRFRTPTNKRPPVAHLNVADVRRWYGYKDGTRTTVILSNGRRMQLDVSPEEFEAAYEAEQRDMLRRRLDRALAQREEHKRQHPEFAHFWPLVEAIGDALAEESLRRGEARR